MAQIELALATGFGNPAGRAGAVHPEFIPILKSRRRVTVNPLHATADTEPREGGLGSFSH